MPLTNPDPATDAFLHVVDRLDCEARTVTHAVALAQAVVRSLVGELQAPPSAGADEDRAWAETGLRLMQHRAALVEALARIPQPRRGPPAVGPTVADEIRPPVPPQPRVGAQRPEGRPTPPATVSRLDLRQLPV